MGRIDKMSFIDGTVKWELRVITNAKTLEGNTLQEILNQIPRWNISIIVGTLSVTDTSPKTIPLPSGFTRQQCKYFINRVEYDFAQFPGTSYVDNNDVNQDTDSISLFRAPKYTVKVPYMCICLKAI